MHSWKLTRETLSFLKLLKPFPPRVFGMGRSNLQSLLLHHISTSQLRTVGVNLDLQNDGKIFRDRSAPHTHTKRKPHTHTHTLETNKAQYTPTHDHVNK